MSADDDLDIPMGGCLDQVIIALADHFEVDPLEYFDRIILALEGAPTRSAMTPAEALGYEMIAIDLETSTQIPHIRRGIEIQLLADEEMGG